MSRAINCRRAVREDLPAIHTMLDELQRIDGWDYLGEVIESWIEERPGGAYIALDGDAVVGVTATCFPASVEAWWQGIRVLPCYRQSGVGALLADYQLHDSFSAGASVARLAVLTTNEPAKRLVRKRLRFSRARLWSVCSFGIPRADLQAGILPVIVAGTDKLDVLRFIRSRKQALMCAWPHPWVVYSYRCGVSRLLSEMSDREWLLCWPGTDDEPAFVCHAGICEGTFDSFLLVDLLLSRSSGAEAEKYAAGLFSMVNELVRGTDANRIMFSVPSRAFAPVRRASQWLGLDNEQADHWAMEIYERLP